MNKYLISLDKDQQRRDLFFSQPNTADFEVFSAINTMNETWQNLTALFDLEGFKKRYGREVTKGEIGCTLSHLAVYKQILDNQNIADQDYCLICEDDALFNQNFSENLTALLKQEKQHKQQADIILVGQSKINHFNDRELEINYPITLKSFAKSIQNSLFYYAYPYKNYFAGTVAYLIKKSAIKIILGNISQQNKPCWLADDFILFGQHFHLDMVVVRPLMAIENPQLVSNLSTHRQENYHNSLLKLMKYPLKKLLAIKRNIHFRKG